MAVVYELIHCLIPYTSREASGFGHDSALSRGVYRCRRRRQEKKSLGGFRALTENDAVVAAGAAVQAKAKAYFDQGAARLAALAVATRAEYVNDCRAVFALTDSTFTTQRQATRSFPTLGATRTGAGIFVAPAQIAVPLYSRRSVFVGELLSHLDSHNYLVDVRLLLL